MTFLTFIVSNAISLYAWALLMRVWMQCVRSDYYNPFAQAIVRITQPIVKPVRRLIPAMGSVDTATLVVAFVLLSAKIPLLILINGSASLSSLSIPFYLLLGFAGLLKAAGKLLFWVLVVRAIMSWISQGRGAMDFLIHQLTEPFLSPIRRIIPPFGYLDLSVMALVFILIGLDSLGFDILNGWWRLL